MVGAKIKNGIVQDIISAKTLPKDYKKLPQNYQICIGDNVSAYDENYQRKLDEQLIEDGLIKDVRGSWYDENKQLHIINSLKVSVPETWTRTVPNHITDKLVDGVWEEDLDAKNEYNIQTERDWRNGQLITVIDHYQKPLLWEELTDDQKDAVKDYRKALLDYPQQTDFPDCERPEKSGLLN